MALRSVGGTTRATSLPGLEIALIVNGTIPDLFDSP
jgi:hypothetical protein